MRFACECGCGGLAAQGRRFIHGHYARTIRKQPEPPPPEQASVDAASHPVKVNEPQPPPPYPAPYDHGHYRVAEEQPGTDPHQPWRLTFCLECREPTWTHNHNPKTQDEMLCETCAYMLLSEMSETRVKVQNQLRGRMPNPFES